VVVAEVGVAVMADGLAVAVAEVVVVADLNAKN